MGLEMEGRKILVTGAAGFVGRSLVRRLIREGAHVRALDWVKPGDNVFPEADVEFILGDVTDSFSLRPAITGYSVVFHCAAVLCDYRSREFYYRVNLDGSRYVAKSALEAGVDRLVHISSNAVYGFIPGKNVDETAPRRSFGTPYGDTKLAGELYVTDLIKEAALPAVIVQPTVVYGPFDNNWTRKGIRLISSGLLALPCGGAGIFQPLYIDDLVEGLVRAAVHGESGEVYILAGPDIVTFRDFYDAMASILGRRRAFLVAKPVALLVAQVAEWASRIRRRPPLLNKESIHLSTMESTYSSAKASRSLGFRPDTKLNKGMTSVKKWYEGYRDRILSSEERIWEANAH